MKISAFFSKYKNGRKPHTMLFGINTWKTFLKDKNDQRPHTMLFGINTWKTFLYDWLDNYRIFPGPFRLSLKNFWLYWRWVIIVVKPVNIHIWSYSIPSFLERFCEKRAIKIVRVEDGFIRSVQLGALHTTPISLCFDQSGYLYFDAKGQSDLEHLIETYDFAADQALMKRAEKGLDELIRSRLSKYNMAQDRDIEEIYGPKTKKRILVVGQVDGDMSIKKSCDPIIDNNSFVRFVASENPDAQIIYKPHPEVLHKTRKKPPQSDPQEVKDVAFVLETDITLADSFSTIDQVYTMTSLAGFEALLYGLPVYCYGMPFYAGWGVTTDRLACPRRTARRSMLEIFAASYLLYPKYFDPHRKEFINFEQALAFLKEEKLKYQSKA